MKIRRRCGDELLSALKRRRLDTVEGAFAYSDGKGLIKAGLGHRERIEIVLDESDGQQRRIFMKRYSREPLRWRFERLRRYGLRASPAGVEMDNIIALIEAGLPTIAETFCGEQFDLFGAVRSYIILTEVPGESLERIAEGFLAACADRDGAAENFTRRLGELVKKLHAAGFVHRDLYASHIFLKNLDQPEDDFEFYLIDLARMFSPRWRQFRWRVKDLAQLRYSMPPEWVRLHWESFMRTYLGRISEKEFSRFSRAVMRKEARILRRDMQKRSQRSGNSQAVTLEAMGRREHV